MLMEGILIHDLDKVISALGSGAVCKLTENGEEADYSQTVNSSPWRMSGTQTALWKMMSHGQTEIVSHLMNIGVDFTKAAESLIIPGELADRLAVNDSKEAIKIVLDLWPKQYGDWADWTDPFTGKTLLHNFLATKSLTVGRCPNGIIGELVRMGADVNARDHNGNTPLHISRDVDAAKMLVSNGADTQALNNSKNTPLSETVQRLVIETKKRKKNPHNGNVNAAIKRHLDLVKFLSEEDRLLNDPKASTIARKISNPDVSGIWPAVSSGQDDCVFEQIVAVMSLNKAKKLEKVADTVRAKAKFKKQISTLDEGMNSSNSRKPKM